MTENEPQTIVSESPPTPEPGDSPRTEDGHKHKHHKHKHKGSTPKSSPRDARGLRVTEPPSGVSLSDSPIGPPHRVDGSASCPGPESPILAASQTPSDEPSSSSRTKTRPRVSTRTVSALARDLMSGKLAAVEEPEDTGTRVSGPQLISPEDRPPGEGIVTKGGEVVFTRPRSITRVNSLPLITDPGSASPSVPPDVLAAVRAADAAASASASVSAPTNAEYVFIPPPPLPSSPSPYIPPPPLEGTGSNAGEGRVHRGAGVRASIRMGSSTKSAEKFSEEDFVATLQQSWLSCLRDCASLFGFARNAGQNQYLADTAIGRAVRKVSNEGVFAEIKEECGRAVKLLGTEEFDREIVQSRKRILELVMKAMGLPRSQREHIAEECTSKAKSFSPSVDYLGRDDAKKVAADALREISKTCTDFIEYRTQYMRIVKSQACVRRWLAMRIVTERLKRFNVDRNRVFLQMYKAERALCSKLDILINLFVVPLQDKNRTKKFIEAEEESALCIGEARQLYILHRAIFSKLERIRHAWPCVDGVPKIFQEVGPHFKVYAHYALQSEIFQNTLASLERENAGFAAFLQDAMRRCPANVAFPSTPREQRASGTLFFTNLLLAPISQVTTYATNLKLLAKYMEEGSAEYQSLLVTATAMNEVSRSVNLAMRNAHQRAVVVACMQRFGGVAAAAAASLPDNAERAFLFECDLCIVVKKKSKGRRMLLFSDKAVFASPKDKKGLLLTIEEIINIQDAEIRDPAMASTGEARTAECRTCIELVTKDEAITLKLTSEIEKARVLRELTAAYEESQRKTKVFAATLDTIVSQDNARTESGAPVFVQRCCDFLLSHLDCQGLFRVNDRAGADKLRKEVESTSAFVVKPTQDPNAVATCFMDFLRELPEPLFTSVLYPRFLSIDTALIDDEESFVRTVLPLLELLPESHRCTLRVILAFFFEAAQSSDKLDEHMLATLFGASLLRQAGESMANVLDIPVINAVVMGMIVHAESILRSTW